MRQDTLKEDRAQDDARALCLGAGDHLAFHPTVERAIRYLQRSKLARDDLRRRAEPLRRTS